jgi:predicted enzyme related to lactoylglutathione lyase
MSEASNSQGSISWMDLTIDDAEGVREFYEKVAGWTSSPVEMGGYHDFNMLASDQQPVAGICHARGENADLPPQWLIYITVVDLDQSVACCQQLGGKVLSAPRQVGSGRCAVVRDPAGACVALYQSG